MMALCDNGHSAYSGPVQGRLDSALTEQLQEAFQAHIPA
jgi:hypothetical protein